MATRATIIVEGQPSVKAYKHWDGYPEATLPWLEEFNMAFSYARGDDPDYKLAQLLRSSALDAEKFNLDPSTATGWGIIPIDADMGEEYEYFLRHDGSVDYKPVERHYEN
jgi:hypothetical protein